MPVLPVPAGFPEPGAPAPDAPVPPPLDWLTAAKTAGSAVTAKHGATEQLVAAKTAVRRTRRAVGLARARLVNVRRRVAAARARIARLDHERTVTPRSLSGKRTGSAKWWLMCSIYRASRRARSR